MYNSKPMEEGGFRDQQVWDRGAVPHPVVVGQILLESQGFVEEIWRRSHYFKALVEFLF